MDAGRALALAEAARGELLSLLEALVAAPSPVGSSGREAQERLGTYLERNGFRVETRVGPGWESLREHPEFSPPPEVAGAGASSAGGPSAASEAPVNLVAAPPQPAGLTFFAHVDTEPAGEGWTSQPFRAVRRGSRVHGLGTADDKGGLAAAAVAAALLARQGGGAPRVASVHGKGGGARGTLPVFAGMSAPGDCVYVHPPENGAGLAVLKRASRGVLDVSLRLTGWREPPREIGTPESAPFGGAGNALDACLRVVESLRAGELADCEVNLGRLDAGEAPGLAPLRCEAELRVLFRGERTVPGVLAAVRRAAAAHARPAGASRSFHVEVEATGVRANPAETPWDAPLPAGLRRAVADITGREPAPYDDHLASDIRFPIRIAGAPAVGIGSLAGNFYGPNEWADLDDLVRLVALLILSTTHRTTSGA